MSLWGKLLIVFNGLAAVVFLFLASADWGLRQNWAYSAFKHELAIQGLPLEADDPWYAPQAIHAADVGPETAADLFKDAGDKPVQTQQAEVVQKRQELVEHLKALPDAKRREELKHLLWNLARTLDERDAIAKRCKADSGVKTDAILADLEKKFDEAEKPLVATDTPEQLQRDTAEKRASIAHLLYNLADDLAWHTRVQIVIGLNAYQREADRQAADLEVMVQRVNQAIDDDRLAFQLEYFQLIQRRTQVLANQVQILDLNLATYQDLNKKHQGFVAARQNDKKQLTEDLAKAREDIKVELEKQGELEKQKFKSDQDLATKFDENVELEKKIRKLELGR